MSGLSGATGIGAGSSHTCALLADGTVRLLDGDNAIWFDWSGAEEEFERALTLNPACAEAHHMYAHWHEAIGRLDEAVAERMTAAARYDLLI